MARILKSPLPALSFPRNQSVFEYVFERVAEHADKTAVHDVSGRSYTFGQIHALAKKVLLIAILPYSSSDLHLPLSSPN